MPERVRRLILWLPQLALMLAVTLVAGLFYLGRQPIAVGLLTEPWDKVVHASLFAVIAMLLALSRKQLTWHWLVCSVFLAAGVGALDEIHQHFLPGRSADIRDFCADVMGAMAGAALMKLFKKNTSSLSREFVI